MKTINSGGEDVTGAPQQHINLATESDNINMSWPTTSQQHQQQCHLFSDYHKWCDYLTWSAGAVSSTPTVLTWPPPGDVTIDIWPVSNAYQVAWQQYDPSVFLAHQSKACCQYPTPFHALCVIRPSTVSPCDHCQRTYHQTTGVQGFSADMFNVSLSLSDLQVPSDLDLNPDPQCVDHEQVTRGEGETMTSFLSDKNATHLLTDAQVLSSIDRSFITSDNCSTSSKESKDETELVTSAASSTGNSDMPALGIIAEPNTKTARVFSLRKRTASSTSINSSSSSDEEQVGTIVSCASMTPPSSSSSSSSTSARKKRARISSNSSSSSSSDSQWLEEVRSTRELSRPAEPPRKAQISGSREQLVSSSATRQPSIRLSAIKKKACCSSNSSSNKDNSSNNSGNNYCSNSSKMNNCKSNSKNNSDNSSSISGNETKNDYNDNSNTNSRNNNNNNSCSSNGNNKNSDHNYNSGNKNKNSNKSGNNKNNSNSKQHQETSTGADTSWRQSSRLRSRQHPVPPAVSGMHPMLLAVSGMEPNKPRPSSGTSNNHGQAQRRNQQKPK